MRQGFAAFVLFASCSFPHGQPANNGDDDASIDTPMIDAPVVDMVTDDTPPDMTVSTDTDGDGKPDTADNCPMTANADQRDHDGDGKGDVCDHCPHLMNAADPDGDGDGVGDNCDPRPMMAGDSIALFEGFYDAASINAWTVDGGMWAVANGVLTQSSTAANDVALIAPVNLMRAAVTTSAHVNSLGNPSPGNGFTYPHASVTAGVASGQGYWCSVVDDPNGDRIYATYDWNGINAQFPSAAAPGAFGLNSDATLTVAQLGSNSICTVVQNTSVGTVNGNLGPTTTGAVQVQTRTASVSFDYVFVVSIGN